MISLSLLFSLCGSATLRSIQRCDTGNLRDELITRLRGRRRKRRRREEGCEFKGLWTGQESVKKVIKSST